MGDGFQYTKFIQGNKPLFYLNVKDTLNFLWYNINHERPKSSCLQCSSKMGIDVTGLPILLTSINALYPIYFLQGFLNPFLSLSLYYEVCVSASKGPRKPLNIYGSLEQYSFLYVLRTILGQDTTNHLKEIGTIKKISHTKHVFF